ncbi:hypothetical protein CPC08DRAFT_466515 [Agrocybe pediades]|nr:hypothetical protein CPC08DRAFT_466515 [Agrocybe pediades]
MESILGPDTSSWEANPIGYFNMQNIGLVYGQPTGKQNGYLSPIMVTPTPTQLFTPPNEEDEPGPKAQAVSVSSSFFPGSHNAISDTIFRSSDGVLFYVTSKVLLSCSKKIFQEFLGASIGEKRFRDVIIDIPESSAVLNIIIHTVYGISVARHSPSFEDVETAIYRMPAYGIAPKDLIVPTKPLYELLLSQSPLYHIKVYTLAGHFKLEDLAVKVSSHLLSYDLSELTDDLVRSMGATYLKRLMCLHYNLVETLKSIILQPPGPHPVTPDCDFLEQKKLSRAWALAASYLAWDSRPDLSIHAIQSTFAELGDRLDCDECKRVLKERIKEVVVQWVNVKRTI